MPRLPPLALSVLSLVLGGPLWAQSYRDDGTKAYHRGDFDAAASLYEKSVATALKSLKEEDIEVIERRAELGEAYRAAGRLEEAIKQLDYVWKRARFDAENRNRWAVLEGRLAMGAAENLGRAYLASGRYAEALLIFSTGLFDAQRTRHDDIALQFAAMLAETQFVAGNDVEAATLTARAFSMAEKLTSNPVLQSRALSQLSALCLRHNQLGLAKPMAQRALDIAREHGAESLSQADYEARLAAALVATGGTKEAEALLAKARKTILARETAQSLRLVDVLLPSVDIALKQKRITSAAAMAREALDICRRGYAFPHPQTGRALEKLADCELAQRHPKAARRLYEDALAVFEKTLGGDDPFTEGTRAEIGRLDGGSVSPAVSSAPRARGR